MGFVTSDVFLLSFNAGARDAQSPSREVLLDRIAAVGPEVVVTLGEQAAQLLLQSGEAIGNLRGRFYDFQGIVLMPTLHPDAMLENAALKREVWSDMQQVMRRLAQPG
jgi:uracil-DNA glycosylase family 4